MKVRGETVYILDDGYDNYETLPKGTHGELSILDNKVFAIAKRWWRLERGKYPVYLQDLFLIYCIDSVNHEKIKGMWVNNFMLDKCKPKLSQVEDMLKTENKASFTRQILAQRYIEAYLNLRERQEAELECGEVVALRHTLDGMYWKEMKERRKKK